MYKYSQHNNYLMNSMKVYMYMRCTSKCTCVVTKINKTLDKTSHEYMYTHVHFMYTLS